MNLRNPAWVFIGVMQPVLYLVLFGPLLKPLVDDFGADNAYTFLVPGLLVQLGMFGAFFAGFGLIGEWREGVIEAERVTPANRTALLVGRLVRDVAQLFVQALILVVLGYAMGMRASVEGVVARHRAHPAGRRRLRRGLQRPGADHQERGRDGPGHQHGDDAGAAALGDPAPDDARPGVAAAGQRLHAVPLDRRRGPRHLQRRLRTSGLMWGTTWALVLFGLAVWWGTAVFRKENAWRLLGLAVRWGSGRIVPPGERLRLGAAVLFGLAVSVGLCRIVPQGERLRLLGLAVWWDSAESFRQENA